MARAYLVPMSCDSRSECGGGGPEVELVDSRGRRCSMRDVRGRPVLVAFVPDEAAGASFTIDEAIWRAELRGLGAALIVVAENSYRLLQPDDAVELLTASLLAATVREQYEVAEAGSALLLLDERGAVAWRFDEPTPKADSTTWLLTALQAAARVRPVDDVAPVYMNRRELMQASLLAALSIAMADRVAFARTPPLAHDSARITLSVNGKAHTLTLEPRVTLLDALREQLGFTGTKKGCDHGQCGACTVLVDGRRINSCLTLAIMNEDVKITTIEGLASGDSLHRMQAAFLARDAFQCGYCTPGQILSAVALVNEGTARTPAEIREQMSGNICRCGAYPNIVAAVHDVMGG